MMNRKRPWPDLPPEILLLIAKRLGGRLLLLRFRAVCRSWRSSCPLPPYNNLLSSSFPRLLRDSDYLTASTVYLIEPLEGGLLGSSPMKPRCWLAMVNELNPGKLCLHYPLSKRRSYSYPIGFPKDFNLWSFRITEIANSCSVTRAYPAFPVNRLKMFGNFWNFGIDKVILFPYPSFTCDSKDSANHYLVALLSQCGSLSIFSLGDAGKATRVHGGERFKLDDIVNYKGRIYGIDRRATLYAFDYESYEMTKTAAASLTGGRGRRKRLVESNGDLYLVTMQSDGDDKSCRSDIGRKMNVKAYKLNEWLGKWTEVRSLGDRVFFVGTDCSFSFSAQVQPRFDGNCVFAFDDSFRRYGNTWNTERYAISSTVGMFHLIDGGTFVTLRSGSSGALASTDEDAGMLRDIFWPPPTWLVPETYGMGCSSTRPEDGNTCEAMKQDIGEGCEASGDSNTLQNVAGANKQASEATASSGENLEKLVDVEEPATTPGICRFQNLEEPTTM